MEKSILEGLRSELLGRSALDTLPDPVWKSVSSLNTYGTNSIEGNTLTWSEVEAVLLDSRGVDRPMADIMETIQHDRAFRKLIGRRARAIDLVTMLELHEEVFHGLMPDAGQWRRVNVIVRGARFTPPRPEKVIGRLSDLVDEYAARDLEGEDPFVLGAWLHLGFETVHPFTDGNGRVGRLLLNLHLIKHNWPPVHVLPEDREVYLRALGAGNEGDLDPLIDLIMVKTGSSLLGLLSLVGTAEDELKLLSELQGREGYSAKYLALRADQGELPAVRTKGRWRTSPRALELYAQKVGRGRQRKSRQK